MGRTESFLVFKANTDWEIIRLDFTGDDGTDIYVVRDRKGHYIFIDTGASQDVEKITDYIRATTIEIDAWIMADADNAYVVEELLNNGCAKIDGVYSTEETSLGAVMVDAGNEFEVYGLGITPNVDGGFTLNGSNDEFVIVPGSAAEETANIVLK